MFVPEMRARWPKQWKRWFAWFPVEVPRGYVWLQHVEVRWNKYPYDDRMGYIYRRIGKDT